MKRNSILVEVLGILERKVAINHRGTEAESVQLELVIKI